MIINTHRLETQNSGDINSSPVDFFNFNKKFIKKEITKIKSSDFLGSSVIVGGGGLIDHSGFFPYIDTLCKMKLKGEIKKLIIWGAGTNAHFDRPSCTALYKNKTTNKILKRTADLIGVRDPSTEFSYTPCVSCMHNSFYNFLDTSPVCDIVFYEHESIPLPNIFNARKMRNNETKNIKKTLSFLSSAHTVFTNTFHGAYWALLLGRRVVAMPFSTKFESLSGVSGYEIYNKETSFLKNKADLSKKYFYRCTNLNKAFYRRVRDLI
jgi:hypothetical protein